MIDDEEEKPTGWRRWAPGLGITAVVVLICVAIFVMVSGSSKSNRKPAQDVVKLRLVQPPPPPPPPPPPKIDPPKMKQEFKPLEAPPEPESEPPPGPPALDAAGEGPGDAFGLAGRPGGSEYLGGAGGGGGSPFARYAAMVQQKAQQSVERQSRLRVSRFRVTVKIWFEPDGSTRRVEIETSTGDAEIDKLLESSLMAMEKLTDGPPKGMPQPVVLRVSTS